MATKSQRKQQKIRRQQRKRLKERQLKKGNVLQGNSRHRQRLAQQKPRAWNGETPEEVAVFEDSVVESLSPELANQVSAVREALQVACESRGDEALKCVSRVSRSSPLSQWRLFIRGLVPWMADDTAAASEAWRRLDPERRPGRIAIAMMVSLRTDLDSVGAGRWADDVTSGSIARVLRPQRRITSRLCDRKGTSGKAEMAAMQLAGTDLAGR
jgi:hypothetical protein